MADGFTFDWRDFEANFVQRAATASRPAAEILLQQSRGIFRTIVEISPPGGAGLKAGSAAATERGRAKIAGDLAKLYGTPSSAYDAILKKSGEARADAFWALRNTRPESAARIVRRELGASFSPWDDGALHRQQFKRGRVNAGRRQSPLVYVRDAAPLKQYIKDMQGRVNYLAGGWEAVAAKLGISLPASIAKHHAPSAAVVDFTIDRLRVIATNAVKYASDTDLQRRIQWAIDVQAAKMKRQWEAFASMKK